jgi:hypothetical protein
MVVDIATHARSVATAAIDPIEVGICRDIIASPQATRFYCNASQLWALWGFSTARKSYLLSDLTVSIYQSEVSSALVLMIKVVRRVPARARRTTSRRMRDSYCPPNSLQRESKLKVMFCEARKDRPDSLSAQKNLIRKHFGDAPGRHWPLVFSEADRTIKW